MNARKTSFHLYGISILALLLGLAIPLWLVSFAHAAGSVGTIIVNATYDTVNNSDGKCTLREAIIAANKGKPSGSLKGECLGGSINNLIIITPTVYTLTRTDNGNEDASATGDLDISSNITLTVSGTGQAKIVASNFTDRIIQVLSGRVSISNVMISGGKDNSNGGAIANAGNLYLTNTFLTGNSATGQGGAIYNAPGATLTISGSAIISNTAGSSGGGLANYGTSTLINDTLSGNSSTGPGGAILSQGISSTSRATTNLNFVTITKNQAKGTSGSGGGASSGNYSTINSKNTIYAGNTSLASASSPDCSGTINSLGYNLIQNATGCTINGIQTSDLVGTSAKPVDPKLDSSLANNGGPTPNFALSIGSPAINAGSCKDFIGNDYPAGQLFDQRGIARPQGSTCDMGAYEFVDTIPPTLTLPTNISKEATGPAGAEVTFIATATDNVDSSITVTCTSPSGSIFPLGTTTVSCSATDSYGNTATGSFVVTVSDTTPPVLTLPANMTVSATSSSGAAVAFTTTASDLVDGNIIPSCTPASGSIFPIGDTTVSCTATDKLGNIGSGSFKVTVVDPPQSGPVYSVNSTVISVTSTTCTLNNCSLADAILAANARPNGSVPDQIQFNLPKDSNGLSTITFQSGAVLPAVIDPVIINGFSQACPDPSTQTVQTFTKPVVILDGTNAGTGSSGLTLQASNSIVCGLSIRKFSADGINISSSGNKIINNAISQNGGAGVHVTGGTGNTFAVNLISTNSLGGIKLENGTNAGQQAPTISIAINRTADAIPTTDVGGVITGVPSSAYRIELFSNSTCTGAQGETFQVVTTATTDASGKASFVTNIKSGLALGAGITGTATGPDGSSSAFSSCTAIQKLNDSWLEAQPLNMASGGASVSQIIYQAGQTRWFKFPVSPGSKIQITVDNPNQSTIVTLHRDLKKIYATLNGANNLISLAADNLPGTYLPGTYLPGTYLPGTYLPGTYLPGTYLPGTYLPGTYLPGTYLPGTYLPGTYLPGTYLPGTYLTNPNLPNGYLPELYSGAVVRSLIAVANDPRAVSQTIERNTWDLAEDLYIQVSTPTTLSQPFSLHVNVQSSPTCPNYTPLAEIGSPGAQPVIAGAQPTSGSSMSLIVWDSQRMLADSNQDDINALRNKLAAFSTRDDIRGIVIDLAALENGATKYPRVQSANQVADANRDCITAKNAVASEIKNVIDSYRAANASSMSYIILVGSDYQIPFFRYPDQAGLASEKEYIPPVAYQSSAEASLRQGQVLGQDAYGAQYQILRSGYSVPVPQLAVGRLVRTAAEVSGMLDAYTAAGGVITPNSALVTGYDFVTDAATKVKEEFTAGLNQASCANQPNGCVDSLIGNNWNANDLRGKLIPSSGNGSNLIFLASHFSAGSVLAADYATSLYASEIFSSPVNFTNSLVLILGCHSGYNIPLVDELPYSPNPDWSETFASHKSTLIAATGYAYGDTDLTEYGEKLFYNLARELRTLPANGDPNTPVMIGQALINAKRDYMAQHATLEGIDDKTVLETTLYGLPMLKIKMQGSKIAGSQAAPIVGNVSNAASGTPGANIGLKIGQPAAGGPADLITVQPSLTRHDVTLTNYADNTSIIASYFSGTNGDVVTRPAEPILPLEQENVSVAGMILRGVGFRGGSYADQPGFTPLTSASTTENSRGHPAFSSDYFYPLQNWNTNYIDTLSNGEDRLLVTPAQYRSDPQASTRGTLRTYTNMDFRLYYLDKSISLETTKADALTAAIKAAAPDIRNISFQDTGTGQLHFKANVNSDPAAGVQEVWVTYTSESGSWYGSWKSLNLQQTNTTDHTLWEADLTLPPDVTESNLRFIVQAANGAGSVRLIDPFETFNGVLPTTQVLNQPTQIQLSSTNVTGFVGASGLLTATLQILPGQSGTSQPIQERTLVFEVKNTSGEVVFVQPAITNYNGQAFLGALNLPPGTYTLTVYFGSLINPDGQANLTYEGYLPSSTTGTIQLHELDCSTAKAKIGTTICTADNCFIWPPNNNTFVPVNIIGVTGPPGIPITINIDGVFQDEPVSVGGFSPDATGIGTPTANLRAERDGSQNGRVYHIFFTATANNGGYCKVDITSSNGILVGVSDNQGGGLIPIDGGPLYDSTKP